VPFKLDQGLKKTKLPRIKQINIASKLMPTTQPSTTTIAPKNIHLDSSFLYNKSGDLGPLFGPAAGMAAKAHAERMKEKFRIRQE